MIQKRKIAVIVGSESDLKSQCSLGLLHLSSAESQGLVDILGIHVASLHRNTEEVLKIVRELVAEGVDVLIVGAGWANHLTGTVDAFLRYTLKDYHVVVVGVAFEDGNSKEHTQAAVASIIHVPGTQVVFSDYIGSKGFMRACDFAYSEDLPTIVKKDPKPVLSMTLAEALELTKPKTKT